MKTHIQKKKTTRKSKHQHRAKTTLKKKRNTQSKTYLFLFSIAKHFHLETYPFRGQPFRIPSVVSRRLFCCLLDLISFIRLLVEIQVQAHRSLDQDGEQTTKSTKGVSPHSHTHPWFYQNTSGRLFLIRAKGTSTAYVLEHHYRKCHCTNMIVFNLLDTIAFPRHTVKSN